MRRLFFILPILLLSQCTSIVNLVSFFPKRTPSETTYRLPFNVEPLFITTQDRKKLECFYVTSPVSDKLVIYFHGNAGNIHDRLQELQKISSLGASVLGVGYRGYGKSTGRPNERGIYKDGAAAYLYARETLGFPENKIIIYGRSLGTTVAVNTACDKNIFGLVLVTPFTDGKDYAAAHNFGFLSLFAGNPFNNIGRIGRIKCKTLIIHGTWDDVAPFRLGKELYDSLQIQKEFVEISEGMHNNLEYRDPVKYWGSIERFLK